MSAPADSPFSRHLAFPSGRGALREAPFTGAAGGAACGDLIRVSVEVDGAVVRAAGFDAEGCGAATVAGSAIVEAVTGRPALNAARLGVKDLVSALGGLHPSKRHAAELAVDALHRAIGKAAAVGAVRVTSEDRRVLVAMSGGVDSALAAQLALDAGHDVVAVTLELWADPENDGSKSCCSPGAVVGARALAHELGIPHFTLDARERFRVDVVDGFLSEHAAARTPNPCVTCNGRVRFDAMLALADQLGAARLATGHYARVVDDGRGPLLAAAADPAKDQTYMLAAVPSSDLARLWFPLGELEKREVRAMARRAGLSVADKAESQDLCFLAGTGRERFLARHGRVPLRPGPIRDRAGATLGRHDGQALFTVGQRRGLGLGGGLPLYVLDKNEEDNTVTVGPRSALATRSVSISGASLSRPAGEVDSVRLRYHQPAVPCAVDLVRDGAQAGAATLVLAHEVDGVAPGQVACLMRGETVLGWAMIEGGNGVSSVGAG